MKDNTEKIEQIVIPNQKEIIEYISGKKKLDSSSTKIFRFFSRNWGYPNSIHVKIYAHGGIEASIKLKINGIYFIDSHNQIKDDGVIQEEYGICTWHKLQQKIKEYINLRNDKEKLLAMMIPKGMILEKCVCCLEMKGSEHCQTCNACICRHCLPKLSKEDEDEEIFFQCPVCRTRIEYV